MPAASPPGCREVQSVTVKRNHVHLTGPDKYGHWWIEIGDPFDPDSESYGWWPREPLRDPDPLERLVDTLTGVAGSLNGHPGFPGGSPTRDPHHGDAAEDEFHPLVPADDPRTDGQIADCLRAFARRYSDACGGLWRWQFGFGPNCHTFQDDALRHCGLYRPGRVA